MYMTRKYYLLGLLGIIAGILIDQGTKMLAVAHLKGQEAILIIPNVFQLQYLENHGAAFGILQNKRGFLLVITICILVAIIFFYRKIPAQKAFFAIAYCHDSGSCRCAGKYDRSYGAWLCS